ncbi:acetyltransferase [Colletotrichum tofieldiae]|uniref:Acetyltransferase n=1 Tax=Colletotrichum tofieldiae TaxID=708197 RepID=A0A166ST28_9PEZI|nr:acetyltransferase [Colletotrichum tofieldiae]GKT60051.1 acetyltransferase [Colletotrichum tofieldiae]GKT67769.1 acetyltransferase [Colletotrichum tofieldiae]GKT91271.1 acetyltransferase [Colletotrichum tofieldiae]
MAELNFEPEASIEYHSLSRANADDVPAIQSMIRVAYSKYIDRIGKEPAPMKTNYDELIKTQLVYVLQNDDSREVVGAIVLRHDPVAESLHINNLVVAPAAQRRGYGRVLMGCAEDVARAYQCTSLQLYTNIKMYENLVLYPKMGFIETERKIEDGYERVYFRRELAGSKC